MTRSLRALHIHSGNLYGGVETILTTLARYRRDCDNLEQDFALCFHGRLGRELRASGASVALLGPVRLSRPWTSRGARHNLRAILRDRPYDVALCHSAWSQLVFGREVRKTAIPLILWQHSADRRLHWLDRWARRTPPDLVLCNSHYTARQLAAREPGLRAEVVYAPVSSPTASDTHAQRERLRGELRADQDTTVILQVGRIEPGKGHRVHLTALGDLRDVPRWVLWQVGGPQRAAERRYLGQLQEAAGRLGISDRVRFLGERSDSRALFAAADVYCQPNTTPESFGITFVEALYAGLPIVTSRLGGAQEIVDGSCGLLVPPGEPKAVAGALRTLIDDPATRAQLGEAGPHRARALCDPRQQLGRLYEVLAELC